MRVQEMLDAQYEGLAQQDAQLDRVEAAVGRVHDQAATMRGEVEPGSYRGAERPGLFGGRDDSGERLTAAGPVVRIQIRDGRGR